MNVRPRDTLRLLAGGSVSLLGVALSSIPLYDIWDDVSNLSWTLVATLVENVLFLLLAVSLVAAGVWLVRVDWDTPHVVAAARRTLLASAAVAALIGWAAAMQFQAMGALKPEILGLNGVLVGTATSFAMAVSSVGVERYREATGTERARNERLTALLGLVVALDGTGTRAEASDVLADRLGDVLGDDPARLVLDGETVAEVGPVSPASADPAEVVPVGDRGYLELFADSADNGPLPADLLATSLDTALQRVDREAELRDRQEVLAFVNRTLRHDLTSDVALVRARLRMLDRNAALDETEEEHLDVALDRVEEMSEFLTTMRSYMQSALDDGHANKPVALAPLLEDKLETFRQDYPDAEVRNEGIPSVTVVADELLDRVFVNVLRNAVEHADASSTRVVVDGTREDDVVVVRVADDGPGIAAERREHVFERGERGSESGGTGFGLSLVRDVVENYGGAVRLRDNDPQGTVFELELPIADGRSDG